MIASKVELRESRGAESARESDPGRDGAQESEGERASSEVIMPISHATMV